MMDFLLQDCLANSKLYAWGVLPGLIFIARVSDVTIGTIRLIFISRGMKYMAPLAGFFEVLIWILVIGQIMQNLTNPACYVAYAAGFATGNYVGIYLAEKLSLGMVIVRIITQKDASSLLESMKARHFGVTVLDGHGAKGKVQVIFTVIKKAHVQEVQEMIRRFNPQAFYSIEEVGDVAKGVFPARSTWRDFAVLRMFRPFRKSK